MAIDYPTLKNELLTDPQGYGYAPLRTANPPLYQGLADVLNFARDGATACPVNAVVGSAIQVKRSDIASSEIWEALDMADLPALPTNPNNTQLSTERRQLSWLEGLANIPRVRLLLDDGTDTRIRTNLLAIFPAGSGTRTRLATLAQRTGSRTEALFGTGTHVTDTDCARALTEF